MEVNGSSDATPVMSICVRAGCNNPAIESKEWDKEYCSNECVVTHCRCVGAHARLLFSPREDESVADFGRVFQRRVRGVVLHQEPDDGNGQIETPQFPEQNGGRRAGTVQ